MSLGQKSWENPVGFWEVSTEGDCEGRSMRRLGIFNGHFCDIAFGLADKCCYSLHFRKIDPSEMIVPFGRKRESVQITFDDVSYREPDVVIEGVRKIANPINIDVEKGMWNGHVTLRSPVSAEERKARALAKAKEKLTPEELEVLGLA